MPTPLKPKTFRRVEKTWDEFWAEFWRIRLVQNDEAVVWKNQQVIAFANDVLGVKPGMTLLDLGCGAGYQALLFAEQGVTVHGVDISPRSSSTPTPRLKSANCPRRSVSATCAPSWPTNPSTASRSSA